MRKKNDSIKGKCLENCICDILFLNKKRNYIGNITDTKFIEATGFSKVYLSNKSDFSAIKGDEITIKIISEESPLCKNIPTAVITNITKRNTTNIICKICAVKDKGFGKPIDRDLDDIFLTNFNPGIYKDSDIVEVLISSYPKTSEQKIKGSILQKVSNDEINIQIFEKLYNDFNLHELEDFSDEVKEELKLIPTFVSGKDIIGRVDKRNCNTYTIDGEDAKDLDDAISVSKDTNENFLLSVFIADVSHYVKEGSNIYKEALKRGTSIYIPDKVFPMLPKELSNGICSLNAGVDRLAIGLDLVINPKGNVIKKSIYKCVINVNKRMTYENVYHSLRDINHVVYKQYFPFLEDLMLMEELSLILNKKRRKNGSINFDIPEPKIILTNKNEVVNVKAYEKTFANNIIEEFMITANEEVAKMFEIQNIPFVYRIHEKPAEDKMDIMFNFLKCINVFFEAAKNINSKTFSKILENIEDDEMRKAVSTVMLKCTKLAKYNSSCLGHFGLGILYYCHFTSPIRRFADLTIHMVISDYIDNNYFLSTDSLENYSSIVTDIAIQCSKKSEEADTVEKAFDKVYQTIFMQDHIGEVYEGYISSVMPKGIFIKLDNTIEGFISKDKFPEGSYTYDESSISFKSSEESQSFSLGKSFKIKVTSSNVFDKHIDFEFA